MRPILLCGTHFALRSRLCSAQPTLLCAADSVLRSRLCLAPDTATLQRIPQHASGNSSKERSVYRLSSKSSTYIAKTTHHHIVAGKSSGNPSGRPPFRTVRPVRDPSYVRGGGKGMEQMENMEKWKLKTQKFKKVKQNPKRSTVSSEPFLLSIQSCVWWA